MTKLELLEKYYGERAEIRKRFEEADLMRDKKALEACGRDYDRFIEKVRAEGRDFSSMMRLYSSMKKRGNSRLDLDGAHDDAEILTKVFREYGIKEFTISSTWSNCTEMVWDFIRYGCQLKGMTEICGPNQKFRSDEYERIPAFILTL